MLGILVERARAIKDLPVLLIIVALGARFVDGSDDVVWPVAAILARLGPFLPISTTVIRITTVIKMAVELGAELTMVKSSDEGGDDLSFRDVGDRVPHLGKASDVAAEELRWLLVDVV